MSKIRAARQAVARIGHRASIVATAAIVMALAGPSAAQARCTNGAASAFALAAPNLDAVVARVQQRYNCSRSLQANFDETISSPGAAARTRSGTVYFRKVGRMRWDFAPPSEGTVVSDGRTVYDYEKDLDQVVEWPVSKALKGGATAFLLGLGNIRRDFRVSLPATAPADGLTHLILTPKSGGDTMELGLDPKSYDIINFRMTNQVGGVTELRFSDIRTNIALDDSLFIFKVPAGADIVRPEQN